MYVEQVTMKPYVHLQGAGQQVTLISSTVSSGWLPTHATLVLASDTSLRDLTVSNSGTGDRNVALMATAGMTRTLAADVTLHAQGSGTFNYAIFLTGNGTGVTLQQVTALAENGSTSNWGLYNFSGAAATLRGGSFTGRGGTNAFGIYNGVSNSKLEADCITALGENASSDNRGMTNYLSTATLRGSSFTGRGGTDAYGIDNSGSGAKLKAESVTALGENGSSGNRGLNNSGSAEAKLRGGSFTGGGSLTGSGGISAIGINNADSGSTLEAEMITAQGVNGSNNYGLFTTGTANVTQSLLEGASNSVFNSTGSITVSNSRLVGGAKAGTVTCVLVTRGTTVSADGSTCP
jgi:hypothetical protein